MSVITEPPKGKPLDGVGHWIQAWSAWFQSAFYILMAQQDSGPTANRPTQNLWIGRRYFDTSLGKPVFLKSTGPNVWVDGVGTVS